MAVRKLPDACTPWREARDDASDRVDRRLDRLDVNLLRRLVGVPLFCISFANGSSLSDMELLLFSSRRTLSLLRFLSTSFFFFSLDCFLLCLGLEI